MGKKRYPLLRDDKGVPVVPEGFIYVPAHVRTRQVGDTTLTERVGEHIRPVKRGMARKARDLFRSIRPEEKKTDEKVNVKGDDGLADTVVRMVKAAVVKRLRQEINSIFDKIERGL